MAKQTTPLSIIQRGLIVRAPWAQALMDGTKQWELRNRPTQVRERVDILEGGSCMLLGSVEICDCLGPLGPKELRDAAKAGLILTTEVHDADHDAQYAWVVRNPQPLDKPEPYIHPRGAVTWVKRGEARAIVPTKPRGPR